MARMLVVGADGAIGQALCRALEARGDNVIGTTRRSALSGTGGRVHLDLAHPLAIDSLPDADVAVICAAMARYADCREQPELARHVNVDAPAAIAQFMSARGGHTVLLSTSAVFDCREPHMPADAPPRPTSAYGRLKADAEKEVLAFAPHASVLRLTKVLTADTPLIRGWIDKLRGGYSVEAFSDMTIAPLTTGHVTDALLAVIDARAGGIYQASGARDISYADIARFLARRRGADPMLVRETRATDNGVPEAEVARYTSLDTSRLKAICDFAPPDAGTLIENMFGAFR